LLTYIFQVGSLSIPFHTSENDTWNFIWR
jgi:hypothetical protein